MKKNKVFTKDFTAKLEKLTETEKAWITMMVRYYGMTENIPLDYIQTYENAARRP